MDDGYSELTWGVPLVVCCIRIEDRDEWNKMKRAVCMKDTEILYYDEKVAPVHNFP